MRNAFGQTTTHTKATQFDSFTEVFDKSDPDPWNNLSDNAPDFHLMF